MIKDKDKNIDITCNNNVYNNDNDNDNDDDNDNNSNRRIVTSMTHRELSNFLKEKVMILLVGESGSGKTTLSHLLSDYYEGLKELQSYTTRAPRYKGEKGHTFVTMDDYIQFCIMDERSRADDGSNIILAENKFCENMYWCTRQQIEENNIYVIDVKGLKMLKEKYNNNNNTTNDNNNKFLLSIYVKASERARYERMVSKRGDTKENALMRIENDREEFKDAELACDFTIDNEIDGFNSNIMREFEDGFYQWYYFNVICKR